MVLMGGGKKWRGLFGIASNIFIESATLSRAHARASVPCSAPPFATVIESVKKQQRKWKWHAMKGKTEPSQQPQHFKFGAHTRSKRTQNIVALAFAAQSERHIQYNFIGSYES